MHKKATTVDVQIAKLHSRGMVLDINEEKIKEHLLDIGYYRLGFYWYPFEIDKKHNLKKGTKFSDALSLYYLDVDLRNLLIKYLNRIEANFKTNLIYFVSNKFKQNNKWFVDNSVVSVDFIEGKYKIYKGGIKSDRRYGGFKKSIYTDSFKYNNLPLRKHHRKYKKSKYAPAWKTIEFLTFGQAFTTFISLLDNDLKKEISSVYGIQSVTKFENYIRTLVDLRNACAHGNVLFDYQSKNAISSIPFLNIVNESNQSIASCVQVLTYFVGAVSLNRKTDFSNEINDMFVKIKKQFPQNILAIENIILNKMKFNI
jgi:abortive infection bacteriophage resistance protein